jgi:hypothetical protein
MLSLVMFARLAAAGDIEGIWKLDSAKSKLRTEYTSYLLKIERTGPEAYHTVVDTVTKAGEKAHSESSPTFDGKERPVQRPPAGRMEIFEHPNSSTWKNTIRREGKVVFERTTVMSEDNKTQTAITKGISPNGKPFEDLAVFVRQ